MERHGLTNEQKETQQNGEIDWEIFFVDGNNVHAHRSAARASPKVSPNDPKNRDLGDSRGGYGTKIHLVCDANGNYRNAVLSAGPEHET